MISLSPWELVGKKVILLVDGSPSSGLKRGDLCAITATCAGRCSHRPQAGDFIAVRRGDGAEGNHFERQEVAVVE